MQANNCKLVISVTDGVVNVEAENASLADIAELSGFLQVFVGQEGIKRGMNIDDVKDNLLDLCLASMEVLNDVH